MPIADPEARKAYHRDYYQRNRDAQLAAEKKRQRTRTPEQQEARRRYQQEYYAANRERLLEDQRQRGRRNYQAKPESYRSRQRRNMLMRKYGLTETHYQAMLAAQEGCCLICSRKMRVPVIDHCHETGKVRGLLCRGC